MYRVEYNGLRLALTCLNTKLLMEEFGSLLRVPIELKSMDMHIVGVRGVYTNIAFRVLDIFKLFLCTFSDCANG